MKVVYKGIKIETPAGQPTFYQITGEIRDAIKESGIQDGICVVFSRHTTCSIITDEDSLDLSVTGLTKLQQDLVDVMETMIPTCRRENTYLHPGPKALAFAAEHDEDARGCHNTDAHLRSSIVGRNVVIPIVGGQPELGDFSHVYFIDFDQTRPRKRTVSVQILGE